MKCRFPLFALLLFVSTITLANPNKPLFFLTNNIEGDSLGKKEVEIVHTVFFSEFSSRLKQEFPCVQLNSIDVVTSVLGLRRDQLLLGMPGAADNTGDIATSMGSDYLVVFNVKCFSQSGTMLFNASCTNIQTGEKMINETGLTSVQENWSEKIIEMTGRFMDGFKAYEICPYKGLVHIQVLTDSTDTKTEAHTVYCSKMDRQYKKTLRHEKKSNAEWNLEKTGKTSAGGTVSYSMAEKHSIDELDECFTCESMVTGTRHYTDNTVSYAELQGLSDRNSNMEGSGDHVKYATMQIRFGNDDTYTIRVEAASQEGELKTIREEKADGDCQVFSKPQEQYSNKTDAGLREILGPYKGNGLDKALQQDITLEKVDPVTQERTTFKIRFDLKRD